MLKPAGYFFLGAAETTLNLDENFERMPINYKKKILPPGAIRIAIEAGVSHGWEKWIFGEGGNYKKATFVGMDSFGASGPAEKLFEHFKITASEIVLQPKNLLKITQI